MRLYHVLTLLSVASENTSSKSEGKNGDRSSCSDEFCPIILCGEEQGLKKDGLIEGQGKTKGVLRRSTSSGIYFEAPL